MPVLRDGLSDRQQIRENFSRSCDSSFRHFPLAQAHPFAETAAEAAEFCGAHGRFWDMHDERYENQATLNDESLALPLVFTLAEAMGLSTAPLQDPFARGEYARRSVAIFSVACAPA